MRFNAVATDFDGTLAHEGRATEDAIAALEKLRSSGRALVLVTGRELDDLRQVFERLELFDRVVAENGGVLYAPGSNEDRTLADPPPEAFVDALRSGGVDPLSVGRVIVATREPHQDVVVDTIRELGLELQVVYNRGAVMVLPPGVNKATGLEVALDELGLSFRNVVGIGDAENDHAFLGSCEVSVAVADAVESLKDRCDHVTEAGHSAGFVELSERIVDDDLSELAASIDRLLIPLGTAEGDGSPIGIRCDQNLMIAGPSASGKSSLATGFLETLIDRGYQFCLVDPEGDYDELEQAVRFGDAGSPPVFDSVLDLLADHSQNATVNLLGVPLRDRPAAVAALLPRLQELRAKTGRPDWIVVDEAHHVLPHLGGSSAAALPEEPVGMAYITVHPDHVARQMLSRVDLLVATDDVQRALGGFADAVEIDEPTFDGSVEPKKQAVAWFTGGDRPPILFTPTRARQDLQRHIRKYARGDMEEDAFVFRGPNGKLNLRAQNLEMFVQIGSGVDDETWLYHLQRGDYSAWVEGAIRDDELTEAIRKVEEGAHGDPDESRRQVAAAIEERYTAPE